MPDLRAAILAAAPTLQGIPYRLDPPPDGVTSIDCSLSVLKTFERAGAPFPPGVRTAEQLRQVCVPIGWSDVKPADLLFFEGTYDAGPPSSDGHIASHVGISLGAGTGKMWDAHERDGNPSAVGLTTINPSPYWQQHLFEARRPPQLVGTDVVTPTATLRGIDVASYQGSPDWDAVAASGVSFAISKVTEDDDYVNPTFTRNWNEIRRVGLVRGAYHFARPDGPTDATVEAEYFIGRIESVGGLRPGDMLALDLEAGSGDLGRWALGFLHRVEQLAGVHPLVYTGAWFSGPHNLGAYPELGTYGLWLAAYQSVMPAPPAPWSSIAIWQDSSDGDVPGIVGDVDTNVFTGTREALLRYGLGGGVQPPAYYQPGDVGSGLLELMAADGTAPASPSTFLPLGRAPAMIEECQGLNGVIYRWHLPTGRSWRHPAA